MTYCTTKAALSRFIQLLALENPEVTVYGVSPRLSRTKMPEDAIAGKYKGIMTDAEIEGLQKRAQEGNLVEPPEWCGEAVARLAFGLAAGKPGEVLFYDEHVPEMMDRKTA